MTPISKSFFVFLLALTGTSGFSQSNHSRLHPNAPRFIGDLEMTGPEYRHLLDHAGFNLLDDSETNDPLRVILAIGKRNLDWLSFINATRDGQSKLELSTPATQQGIPITNPRVSNRTIIADGWNGLKSRLSSVVSDVLFNNQPLTTDLGVSDDEFLYEVRQVDYYYQMASRWLLQEPWLDQYAQESTYDVRGYYFLQREPELESKLSRFENLHPAKQAELKTWLIQECINATQTKASCKTDLEQAIQSTRVLEYHRQHVGPAQELWNAFFRIDAFRSDVSWLADQPNIMTIPFRDPHAPAVMDWLRENIQDEFKWHDWALNLRFQPDGDDSVTHIVFKDGATPHVNELAGSEITMDGNRNIDEYSSRWTIRHEYGHVLGLPDCYIEFYDTEKAVMINYQLDITNLMCSRRGKLQQIHIDELKRVYFRP